MKTRCNILYYVFIEIHDIFYTSNSFLSLKCSLIIAYENSFSNKFFPKFFPSPNMKKIKKNENQREILTKKMYVLP